MALFSPAKMVRVLLSAGLAGGLTLASPAPARAVEMRVSRDAIERTLKEQLFGGPDGRYYLKGSPQTPCYTYVEDPKLAFVQDRIVVRVKTHARLGTSLRGACLGITLSVPAEVSLAPDAEGETIGFRDARLDRVSDQKELNFLLNPFLSRQVPSSMKVDAAACSARHSKARQPLPDTRLASTASRSTRSKSTATPWS